MLRRCRVRRWYSSKLSSTWAGLPRSVMNTGPSFVAFFALVTSWLSSRLESVVMVTMNSWKPYM